MGWLGWTEQQTLDTSIPAIELAFSGRMEMLKACFGAAEEPATPPVEIQTPEHIASVFRSVAR